jgi:hypothetical protein
MKNKLIAIGIIFSLLLPTLVAARAGYRAGGGYSSPGYHTRGGYGSSGYGGYHSRAYQTPGYSSRPQQPYAAPYAYQNRASHGSFFSGLASGLLGAWLYNKIFHANTNPETNPATSNVSNATPTNNPATAATPPNMTTSNWGIGRIILILVIAYIIWRILKRRDRRNRTGNFPQNFDTGPNQPTTGTDRYSDMVEPPEQVSNLTVADRDAFEQLLLQIQQAWSQYDLSGLQRLTTPRMYDHFAQIINENQQQNISNHVSQVRLLNQELQDSWQEGDNFYARVALTWSAIDYAINNKLSPNDPGYLLDGNMNEPIRITEIWTFQKAGGGNWLLTGIEQV